MHPRASIVRRTLSVTIVAALLTTAGAASATTKKKTRKPPPPKPVCHLVGAGTKAPMDQSLKITSADLATNASTLTMVVRVAKLTTGTDATAPTGRQWELDFTADGRQMTLGVFDGPFSATPVTTYSIGTATLDTAKNEVRYSVSLKDLSNATSTTIKNGSTTFSNFVATTASVVQTPPAASSGVGLGKWLYTLQIADQAQSAAKTKYLAGYPSCVAVGK